MKCIAIDDEPVALSILSNYCKRMDGLELITFSNPVTAMLEVNRIKPDLIFLDIKIGEINGIDLARETPASTSLVFTTAYADYALDGFDLNAVDFLHKPFSYTRFCQAIEKVRRLRTLLSFAQKPKMADEEITVKVEYKNVIIRLSDIIYIESMDNYIRIHLSGSRPILSQISMKKILEMLPDQFIRIHKSYIVPLYRISSYSRKEVTLYNSNIKLLIGRAFYNDFSEKINQKNDL